MILLNLKRLMPCLLVAALFEASTWSAGSHPASAAESRSTSGTQERSAARRAGDPSIAAQANLGLDLGKLGQRVTEGSVHDMFPGGVKPAEESSPSQPDSQGRIRHRSKSAARSPRSHGSTLPPPVIPAPVIVEPAPAPVESVVEAPPPPPPPIPTPPFPYKYVGSQRPMSGQVVYFLTKGNQLYTVGIGETLETDYTIDGEEGGQLTVTYLPLQRTQTISTGLQP